MPFEGTQFGRYHLTRMLGSGSMGEVYLAEDSQLKRQVAIKVIRSGPSNYLNVDAKNDAGRLFYREARAIAQLDHPHILPLFDYGETSHNGATLTYMVMPFCSDGSFAHWLSQRSNSDLLSAKEVADFITQAADALQHSHDHGIIHQDVKPSNFLIRMRQGHPDLLLADFGVAKLSTATSNDSHIIRGTAISMAPEQWEGHSVPATDQYALAILAYELLTGHLPFQGSLNQIMYQHLHAQPPLPTTFNSRLSLDVDEVILHAMAKSPEARFSSISAFAQALQQAAQDSDAPTMLKMQGRAKGVEYPVMAFSEKNTSIAHTKMNMMTTGSHHASTKHSHIISSHTRTKQQHGLLSKVMLMGLLLLIIIAGTTFLVFPRDSGTNSKDTTHISNPSDNTKSNANADTSGNTNTKPTTQPVSTDLYTHKGILTLNDPLTKNDLGYNWDQGTNLNGANCQFTDSGLDVTQPKQGYFHSCIARSTHFTNFVYEVQMQLIAGDYGGILFCADTTHGTYYFFYIKPNGEYGLRILSGDQYTQTLNKASSIAILTGSHSSNLLAVVVQNGSISLYVNQRLLATTYDASYTQGEIGVFAGNDLHPAETIFSQAKVWAL